MGDAMSRVALLAVRLDILLGIAQELLVQFRRCTAIGYHDSNINSNSASETGSSGK